MFSKIFSLNRAQPTLFIQKFSENQKISVIPSKIFSFIFGMISNLFFVLIEQIRLWITSIDLIKDYGIEHLDIKQFKLSSSTNKQRNILTKSIFWVNNDPSQIFCSVILEITNPSIYKIRSNFLYFAQMFAFFFRWTWYAIQWIWQLHGDWTAWYKPGKKELLSHPRL